MLVVYFFFLFYASLFIFIQTAQMTDKDEFYVSRAQLLAQMDVAMGGRVAEELIFGKFYIKLHFYKIFTGPEHITTGAASDIQVATEIAMQMVKSFGMSEKVVLVLSGFHFKFVHFFRLAFAI